VTCALKVIQADRARWQRQAAAAELAAILDAHPGLPAIAWTVGPAGSVWLHAAARRDQVRVRLTATVFAGVQEDQ
jgi:hypothetical protein